jgi:hypothetical protein
LATAGFRVLLSARVPDAVASRVIVTQLRPTLLAQAVELVRFFIRTILRKGCAQRLCESAQTRATHNLTAPLG